MNSKNTNVTNSNRFGVGISLFFRFSKSTLCCMFFIFILKVLLILSYYNQYETKNYHPYPKTDIETEYFNFSPMTYLQKYILNLGSLSFGRHKFYEFSIFDDKKKFEIETPEVVKLGSDVSKNSDSFRDGMILVSILPIDIDSSLTFKAHITKCNNVDLINNDLKKICNNKKKCQFEFNKLWFKNCKEEFLKGKKMSIKVRSVQGKIKLLMYHEVNQELFIMIYVGVSAFIFGLIATQSSRLHQRQVDAVVERRVSFPDPCDYTTELKNFPLGESKTEQSVLDSVKEYVDKVLGCEEFKELEKEEQDEEDKKVQSEKFVVDVYSCLKIEEDQLDGKIFNQRKDVEEKYHHFVNICEMNKTGIREKFPNQCLYIQNVEKVVTSHQLEKSTLFFPNKIFS